MLFLAPQRCIPEKHEKVVISMSRSKTNVTRCFVISHSIESRCSERKEWIGIEDSIYEINTSPPLNRNNHCRFKLFITAPNNNNTSIKSITQG